MAKRILLAVILGFSMFQSSRACDACGCSISGGGLGMLTAYRNNFVGLGWQALSFHGISLYGNSYKDYFQSFNLTARYHFTNRFKALLIQPYNLNIRYSDEETLSLHGLADTRILGSYTFLRNAKLGKQGELFFELGAGAKLPTGKYDPYIHQTNLPENFNPGNGSWGLVLQPNAVITHKKAGMIISGNYLFNGRSSTGYHFGNQATTQLLFFREITISEFTKLIPNAGWVSESVMEDKYANDKPVKGTGGQGSFVSTALNLKTSDWMFGLSYSHPITGNYSSGEVKAQGRLSAQLFYNF